MNFGRMIKRIIMGKSPRRTLWRVGILALVSFLLFGFMLLPICIRGVSMEPTYGDGSINFVNTLSYRFREPRRGDIVAIRLAGRRVMLLKRVVGLPGEYLAFREGTLIVNGQPIPEPYRKGGYDFEKTYPNSDLSAGGLFYRFLSPCPSWR